MTAEKQSRQLDKCLRQDCFAGAVPRANLSLAVSASTVQNNWSGPWQREVKWKSKAYLPHVLQAVCSFAILRGPLAHTFSMTVLWCSRLSHDLELRSGINRQKLSLNRRKGGKKNVAKPLALWWGRILNGSDDPSRRADDGDYSFFKLLFFSWYQEAQSSWRVKAMLTWKLPGKLSRLKKRKRLMDNKNYCSIWSVINRRCSVRLLRSRKTAFRLNSGTSSGCRKWFISIGCEDWLGTCLTVVIQMNYPHYDSISNHIYKTAALWARGHDVSADCTQGRLWECWMQWTILFVSFCIVLESLSIFSLFFKSISHSSISWVRSDMWGREAWWREGW